MGGGEDGSQKRGPEDTGLPGPLELSPEPGQASGQWGGRKKLPQEIRTALRGQRGGARLNHREARSYCHLLIWLVIIQDPVKTQFSSPIYR